MGGAPRAGARGHEIAADVHFPGHLGHGARHRGNVLNLEADGRRAQASEHAANGAGNTRNTAFAINVLTFMILP